MPKVKHPPLQTIAWHGWAGDAQCWDPWRAATKGDNWHWQCGERGYGELPPALPGWPAEARGLRVVLGHSLGPHFLPAEVFASADVVVLLASFATFVPPGGAGRSTRAALSGMRDSLGTEPQARVMLEHFLRKVAEPQSADLLPPGPVDGPLEAKNLQRLREDLALLERCTGLPEGFPPAARVLMVEAEEDRIVAPEARTLLRLACPEAEVITLPGVGHSLLGGGVMAQVITWVEARR